MQTKSDSEKLEELFTIAQEIKQLKAEYERKIESLSSMIEDFERTKKRPGSTLFLLRDVLEVEQKAL